jgi:hypothetical protein
MIGTCGEYVMTLAAGVAAKTNDLINEDLGPGTEKPKLWRMSMQLGGPES